MNNEAKHMAGAVEGFIAGIAAMITMQFDNLVAIATLIAVLVLLWAPHAKRVRRDNDVEKQLQGKPAAFFFDGVSTAVTIFLTFFVVTRWGILGFGTVFIYLLLRGGFALAQAQLQK